MRNLLALSALLAALSVGAQTISVVVPAVYRTNSRDAHFNWQFESSGGGSVQMGQFACGSWWVAPANGDTGVTLLSLTGKPGQNDLLSCDADPVTESHGLLSGAKNYGSYNGAENVLANLPQTFTPRPDSCISLLGAMQRNEAETSKGGTSAIVGEVADAYCVVTVMPKPPANGGADMIRPNISGGYKEFLTWDDFDLTRLPTYNFLAGKSAADWEKTRSHWAHATEVLSMGVVEPNGNVKKYSEGGRAFRPHILAHDYASGVASGFNNDVLALMSPDSLESKKAALAAILAYGNDIYHNRYNHGEAWAKAWTSGAGQSSGAYLPPVFMAALSKDESKANNLQTAAIYNHDLDPAKRGPQELRQLTRGQTGVLLWGDGTPFTRTGTQITGDDYRYWSDFKSSACYDTAVGNCNPSTGKKTYADIYGYHDGPANKPGTSYMGVSAGTVQSLAAAMILMPDVRRVVNTDAPIEYIDRLKRHGLWTAPDPVAPIAVVDQTNNCNTWHQPQTCTEWGITWGPNLTDPRFAIEDGVGRFTSLHGSPATFGYTSNRASGNWDTIIAMYDGETYESRAVDLGACVRPEILLESGPTPRVHILEATTDAEVRYTTNGTDPSAGSTLYDGPFPITGQGEIRARAFHPGKTPSAITTLPYSVPEPQAMNLHILDWYNNALLLQISGLIPYENYGVEFSPDLSDPEAWARIHDFIADSNKMSWRSDITSLPFFVRVVSVDISAISSAVAMSSLH